MVRRDFSESIRGMEKVIWTDMRPELRQSIITIQLQTSHRQNLMSNPQESDQESFECNQTLPDSFSHPQEGRLKHCGCRCRCNLQDPPQDPIQKKRQKRKESKRRQKERQKKQKEKALIALERIIRDIYCLRTNFRRAQLEIEQCLAVDNNRQTLCDFINMVIKDEVEFIRKQITLTLSHYETLPEGRQDEAVRAVFAPIERIAAASAEIEKIINVFMASYSVEQETPLQKNFGRTTLKFLVKADLYKSVAFSKICSYIFQLPPEEYPRERQLVNYMMAAFDNYFDAADPELDCSQTEQDTEDYIDYEEDSWEEEVSTIESPKNHTTSKSDNELRTTHEKTRKRRKERRRQLKEDNEYDFEAILKRTQQIKVDESYRTACNVSEEWRARISKLKWKYTKKHEEFV